MIPRITRSTTKPTYFLTSSSEFSPWAVQSSRRLWPRVKASAFCRRDRESRGRRRRSSRRQISPHLRALFWPLFRRNPMIIGEFLVRDNLRNDPRSPIRLLNLLARPTGFEPVTSAFGGQASG